MLYFWIGMIFGFLSGIMVAAVIWWMVEVGIIKLPQ